MGREGKGSQLSQMDDARKLFPIGSFLRNIAAIKYANRGELTGKKTEQEI